MKKKIIKLLINRYFLISLAFVIWCAFFDQNDWMMLQQRDKELKKVKANIAFLQKEIKAMNQEKSELQNNPAKLEKYARETYRMKYDGEDVYVIDRR